jgi:hypothetical protein
MIGTFSSPYEIRTSEIVYWKSSIYLDINEPGENLVKHFQFVTFYDTENLLQIYKSSYWRNSLLKSFKTCLFCDPGFSWYLSFKTAFLISKYSLYFQF